MTVDSIYCPSCGSSEMYWDDQDFEWICHGCGDVFTDEELDEARKEADTPS